MRLSPALVEFIFVVLAGVWKSIHPLLVAWIAIQIHKMKARQKRSEKENDDRDRDRAEIKENVRRIANGKGVEHDGSGAVHDLQEVRETPESQRRDAR